MKEQEFKKLCKEAEERQKLKRQIRRKWLHTLTDEQLFHGDYTIPSDERLYNWYGEQINTKNTKEKK